MTAAGRLFTGIRQCLTLRKAAAEGGRHPDSSHLSIVENAVCAVDSAGRIEWIGSASALPQRYRDPEKFAENERGHKIWLPSLVECHTHCVYAGDRYVDYAKRCAGETYASIAAQGGGILSTVRQTRAASEQALVARAEKHVEQFRRFGVGPLEIKTGYGLDWDTELRSLKVIQTLGRRHPLPVIATFLPAHAIPPEFAGRPDQYVDILCQEWIPRVADQKRAEFFDVFIEKGYFSLAQAAKLAEAASRHGLKIKAHVDQFNDLGGTSFAVSVGAVSCDHLDRVSASGIRDLARSSTVGVLLPSASCYMRTPYPPARELIDAGSRIALSTDFNPGTCPSHNLPLVATLACSQMGMTIPEAIVAMTLNAAAALGLEQNFGSLEVGKRFAVTEIDEPSFESFVYRFGEACPEVLF